MSREQSPAEFWEAHYSRLDPNWSAHPTEALKQTISDAAPQPARALDAGSGHGADTLWLASTGWHVTAMDISSTAVERTMTRARASGLDDRVTPFVADADRELPAGPFDLITACFFYPAGDRAAILHRLSSLVQPGGMLVIVDHASVAPWSWNQHAHEFPTPQQTLATLGLDERWSPIRLAVVPRTATAPDGGTAQVLDNVIAVRRDRIAERTTT